MASNEYFDNADLAALPKGQKARAESVDAKFDAITVGLDKMPTVAETTNENRNFALAGQTAANAYTLALTHITAYSDGLAVQFRVDTGDVNTGASTLDVNGVGPVAIVYPSNTALIADDLPVGSVASVRYSSALSKWVIQTVTNGNIVAATAQAAIALSHANDSDTARAASVTAQGLSEDARDASVTAQGLSEDAQAASEIAQALAEDWASEDEDTPVSGGLFSALHYAAKAATTFASAVLITGNQTIAGIKTFTSNLKLTGGWEIGATAVTTSAAELNDLDRSVNQGLTDFTPVLYCSSTAGSPTYTAQVGKYHRVGNMVFFSINIEISNKGGMSGFPSISGLPFNVDTTMFVATARIFGLTGTNYVTTNCTFPVELVNGTKTMTLRYAEVDGTGYGSYTDTAMNDIFRISIQGVYITDEA